MARISITTTGEADEIFREQFTNGEVKREQPTAEVKKSIEWRGKRVGCEIFRNDQTITGFENRDGVLCIHYEMARPDDVSHEFRVPDDNLQFIQDAINAGILAEGKLLWVTIESDRKKKNWWLKLEEK